MSYMNIFFNQSFRVKRMIVQSFLLSGYYSLIINKRPFKKIAHKLGEEGIESKLFHENNFDIVHDIHNAINMVSRHTPWQCKCLVQAYIAKRMLKKCNIPSTVYLGVRKESGLMKAHAWTKCGDYFVTGKRGSGEYTVTGCFS